MVLHHLLSQLNQKHIVLASASPRRVELLTNNIGLSVRVLPSTFPENLDHALFTPPQYVEENARRKALEVYEKLIQQNEPVDLVIGCDTVVVRDDTILEKPRDFEHAFEMLSSLSGRSHQVVSGCVLIFHTPSAERTHHIVSFHVVTEVTFCTLSREVITAYINTNEPFDKAGGYGMQAKAAPFVEKLNGCYFNVVGLPVHMLSQKIAENIHFLNIEKP